ncbi:TetR/AcrR family transcriptional regulator [Vagococcus elongatus]|uniref:HTH tetR-type domain-containing protein n=1 Tax=Vagococcus elongatus TaxID=180344 RepID=A0A430AP66_9ENTE|nr:TetR/AcrR family transcriptional regulator [Vagococcus elongatus]RSU09677.1 hypothetical protein CBF29_10890 [Vagococcus elongatus]
MTMEKRRTLEKEKMKKLILDAGIKIINEDGFEKLSMRKIAELIGYSPTTIYIYYENKAEIAEDIGIEIYEKMVMDVTNTVNKNKHLTIDKQLKYSFMQFIFSMTSYPEMGKAFIKSGSNTMFKMKSDDKNNENLLHQLLVKGYSEDVLRQLDSHSYWMIITALIGFGMNAIENQLYLLDNWEELVEMFVDILMYGMVKGSGK